MTLVKAQMPPFLLLPPFHFAGLGGRAIWKKASAVQSIVAVVENGCVFVHCVTNLHSMRQEKDKGSDAGTRQSSFILIDSSA